VTSVVCADFKFIARLALLRGHNYPNSQHSVGYNSMASTRTGIIPTNYCHGMKRERNVCLNFLMVQLFCLHHS